MTTLGELLYGLRVPVAPQAGYALRRPSWDLYGGDPHHACHMTAFCRNPLHPGPCKGWKKHLGLVSPGALHALEKLRFEKLEAQRKAKLKQHLAEGKKVPAKLLKPIEYNPERNKDIKAGLADLDLVKKLEPPSAPTKKEIEAKLADKHAGQLDELVQSLDGTNSDVLKTLEKHPNQYVNLTDQQKSEVAAALDAKIQIGTPDEVAKAQALKGKLNIPDPPKPKKPEVTKAGPAQYDSLKSAGLSTGSKVFLHVAHDQDGNAHPAAKGTKGFTTPVLVTVGSKGVAKQSKGGAGGGKVTMSTFTTEDGEVIDGGAHNSKFWMSPASSHPFAEKSGPSAGAPAAAVTSTEEKKGQVADILAAKKASAGIDSVVKAAKMAGASSMVSEKQKSNLHAKLVEAHETGNLSTIEKTAELSAKTIAAKTKEKTGIKLKDDEQKKLQNELDNAFKGGGDTPILDSIDAAWKNPKKLSDMLDALGVPDPFGPDLAADLSKIKPHTQADTYLDHAKAVAGGKYDSNPLMAANLADLITKEQYENDLTSSQKLDLTDAMHQAHTVGNQVVKDKANAVMLKLTGDPIDLPEPPASPTGSDGSLKSNPVAKALELGKSNAAIVSFMEDFPESWDTLTPEQKNEVAGKLHSEYLVGPTTTAIKAENLIKKYDIPKPGEEDVLGKLLDAVPMSTGYLGSGTVPPPHVKNAIDLANGFKSGTAKQKVAAFDQLTPEEYGKLDPNTQKLIQDSLLSAQAKFVDPKKKAQAKAIADKLSVGAGGGAGAGGAGSSTAPPPIGVPSGKLGADTFAPPAAVLATKAEVADKLAKHAGELGLPAHIDAANMTPAASTWLSTSALDNAIVDTGIDGGVLALVNFDGTAAEEAMKGDYAQALNDDLVTPGGLAGKMPDIVMQVNEGATKIQKDMGWASDAPSLLAWKGATFQALIDKELVGKPAGAGGSATPLPTSVKDALDATVPSASGLDSVKENTLKSAYKSLSGSYLKDNTAQENFDNLMAVAAVYSGQIGMPKLTLGQVLASVDKTMANDLGVPDQGLLAAKIQEFLATPGGKKYADSFTPNASKVSQLTGKVQEELELAEFKKNHKHPVYPGPGAFDPSLQAKDFVKHNVAQSYANQVALDAKLGKTPTKAQMDAMVWYTGSGASAMNEYLRHGNGSTKVAVSAKHVEDAMTPLDKPALLLRRTGWEFVPKQYRSYEGMQSLINGTFHDAAFNSTTVAGQPGHYGGGLPVKLEIEAPVGTRAYHAQHFSQFASENEVILGSNQTFKVVGVKKMADGKVVVRVRVVTP